MMSIAGNAYIVVPVETQRGGKGLGSIALALIGELFGALAQIGIKDALQTNLPLGGNLLGFVLGHSVHIGLQQREELVEIVQRVAIERAGEGHSLLRADAIVLKRVVNVVGRTTLCKLAVAMQTNHLNGTVHIGLVSHKRFAEVIGLACLLQDFCLKVRQGGVVPARAGAVLVLDAGNGVFLNDGEYGFVLVDRVLLVLCLCTHGKGGQKCKCQ